jgi:3-deoxy-D-manno-octulosonate 8-phosphate phosphatase (KDO 8-P phosphatase)
LALISGEDSPLVDRLAAKMGITDVYKSCKDKAQALRSFANNRQLDLKEICFMGDDVNDLAALDIAGFAAAPADARPAVIERCKYVAKANGGNGAAREVIDLILAQTRTAGSAAPR